MPAPSQGWPAASGGNFLESAGMKRGHRRVIMAALKEQLADLPARTAGAGAGAGAGTGRDSGLGLGGGKRGKPPQVLLGRKATGGSSAQRERARQIVQFFDKWSAYRLRLRREEQKYFGEEVSVGDFEIVRKLGKVSGPASRAFAYTPPSARLSFLRSCAAVLPPWLLRTRRCPCAAPSGSLPRLAVSTALPPPHSFVGAVANAGIDCVSLS